MTKTAGSIVAILLALVAVLSASASPASAADIDPRQWIVENSATVYGGEEYQLHNLERRSRFLTSQIGYKKGRGQVDYAWTGTSGGHFVFVRQNTRDHRSTRPDEVFALYNTKVRKYMSIVSCSNQCLDDRWTDKPVYEWMVKDRVANRFALWNVTRRDHAVIGPNDEYLMWEKVVEGRSGGRL